MRIQILILGFNRLIEELWVHAQSTMGKKETGYQLS